MAELPGENPARRASPWVVLHALLWLAVGAGGVLLFEGARNRKTTLADAADAAAERLRQLDLTAEQRTALDAIRGEWRTAVLAEEQSYADRLFTTAEGADARIRSLLTEAQRSKYRELSLGSAPK